MKNTIWFARIFKTFFILCGVIVTTGHIASTAHAQQLLENAKRDANAGTVRILTAGVDGAQMVDEIAHTVNQTGSLRVLPIVGNGGVQNVTDVLYLRGIDVGIVHHDTLDLLRSQNTYGKIEKLIRYVTKLYNEEVHLIANQNISNVSDLSGQRVNFGDPGSGTFERADRIFRALGISVVPVSFDPAQAVEKVATGEIAATFYVAPKPSPFLRQIDAGKGLRLLPIPNVGDLQQSYRLSRLNQADYPGLIGNGQSLDTLSVEAIMVVFLWSEPNERSQNVNNFVVRFFDQLDEIQQPYRHPKWKEVALEFDIPGWRRLKVARDWVSEKAAEKRREDELLVSSSSGELEEQFETFLSTIDRSNILQETQVQETTSEAQLEGLFKEFLQSRQTSN